MSHHESLKALAERQLAEWYWAMTERVMEQFSAGAIRVRVYDSAVDCGAWPYAPRPRLARLPAALGQAYGFKSLS